MGDFLKIGDKIAKKPEGCDYNLEPGKIYDLVWDDWACRIDMVVSTKISLPENLLKTKEDEDFMFRVLNNFRTTTKDSMGVLLHGEKGTGKTMLAKMLAVESGLPVLIPSSDVPMQSLIKFFSDFNEDVTLIFDEIQNYNTRSFLTFLDGVKKSACKKLMLFTANDIDCIDNFWIDRCSRVRYVREFKMTDNLKFVDALLASTSIDKSNYEKVKTFIKNNIQATSIDNILSFLEEIENTDIECLFLEETFKYMNIS